MIETPLDLFVIISLLFFGGIWGCLTRLGIEDLNDFNGAIVFPHSWFQFCGCIIMGFATSKKKRFSFSDSKKYSILFVGVTSGYCGSVTSFSSWMLDCFYAIANVRPEIMPRSRGHNFLNLLSQLVVTMAMSLTGLEIGVQIGHLVIPESVFERVMAFTLVEHEKTAAVFLGGLFGIGAWIVSLVLVCTYPPWRSYMFPCLFAPFGTILRWLLSRYMNGLSSRFPWGTYAANLMATILLALCTIFQQRSYSHSGLIGCQVLGGIATGFCGSLSTISTFVAELRWVLSPRDAWIYFTISVGTCLCVVIISLGIENWGVEKFTSVGVC